MRNLLLVVAGTWLAGCGPRTPPAAPVTMTLAEVCAEPRSEERPPRLARGPAIVGYVALAKLDLETAKNLDAGPQHL